MKPIDIINLLKSHQLALDSEEEFESCSRGVKTNWDLEEMYTRTRRKRKTAILSQILLWLISSAEV